MNKPAGPSKTWNYTHQIVATSTGTDGQPKLTIAVKGDVVKKLDAAGVPYRPARNLGGIWQSASVTLDNPNGFVAGQHVELVFARMAAKDPVVLVSVAAHIPPSTDREGGKDLFKAKPFAAVLETTENLIAGVDPKRIQAKVMVNPYEKTMLFGPKQK